MGSYKMIYQQRNIPFYKMARLTGHSRPKMHLLVIKTALDMEHGPGHLLMETRTGIHMQIFVFYQCPSPPLCRPRLAAATSHGSAAPCRGDRLRAASQIFWQARRTSWLARPFVRTGRLLSKPVTT